MHLGLRMIVIICIFYSLPGLALGQPPEKTPTPENPSTDNREIKQLTSILESNEQDESSRTLRIEANPLALFINRVSLAVHLKLIPTSALGIEGAYWYFKTTNLQLTEFSVGGNFLYSFSEVGPFSNGWYFKAGPRFSYFSISEHETSSGVIQNFSKLGYAFYGIGGYQRVWNSGFGIATGLGAAYLHVDVLKTIKSRLLKPGAALSGELQLGYSF